jgi:predicted HTH transcriptional regulator
MKERHVNTEELRQKVLKGESETLELKAAIPRPDAIAQQVAAFANTNGGLLVLGIREPDVFTGVDVDRATAAVQRAQDYLSPRIKLESEVHNIDGTRVVAVKIPASTTLVSSSGAYYRRDREHLRPFTAEEIQRHAQAGNSSEAAIKELSAAVAAQTKTIDQLREEFRKVNSPLRKLGIALAGAVAGVLIKYLGEMFL